ncbi:zinc-ribbon domain-containing protein [Caenispirillum salinarum]|uniref:zinc-ribbon domain-containing protein n=1 Tax=Caenispirillum salinarum TaxID=859058 RepID=UPI00384BEE64
MMTQFFCPHCGRRVEAGAPACPRCLAPIHYGIPRRCMVILVTVGLLVFAYAAGLPALACETLAPSADCDWEAVLRLPALCLIAYGARTLVLAARQRRAVFGAPRLTFSATADSAEAASTAAA